MTLTARVSTGANTDPCSPVRAAAIVLEEEFGVPFAFAGADSRYELSHQEGARPMARSLGATDVQVLPRAEGGYELLIPVQVGAGQHLIARGMVRGSGGDPVREREWLFRWARAVADRHRLTERAVRTSETHITQATRAWEVVLGVDEAIRRTRVHKDDEGGTTGPLEGAREALGAEAVCWIPLRGSFPPRLVGDGLAPLADWEQIAELLNRNYPRPRPATPVVLNDGPSNTGPADRLHGARSVLAVPVFDGPLLGWLAAVGRRERARGAAFCKSDATSLLPFAALLELRFRSARRFGDMRELLVGLTRSLTAAVDAKTPSTHGHSERVARIAAELGRGLGLPAAAISDLYLAGLLHDVGNIGIRDAVLLKSGPLTLEERAHMERHPVIGYEMLSGLRPFAALLSGVRNHHERYDGSGYPDRLVGGAIPLIARVLAVAEGYDAMSTARPYRNALSPVEVIARLRQGSGSQWDPEVIDLLSRSQDRLRDLSELCQ